MKYLDTLNNQLSKILMTLLRLEFKSDNIIQSIAIKSIVKKYCLIISNKGIASVVKNMLRTKTQMLEKQRNKKKKKINAPIKLCYL